MNTDAENQIYYIKVRCRNTKKKKCFYEKIYFKAKGMEAILSYFNMNLKNQYFGDDIMQLSYNGDNIIEAICDINLSDSNTYINL